MHKAPCQGVGPRMGSCSGCLPVQCLDLALGPQSPSKGLYSWFTPKHSPSVPTAEWRGKALLMGLGAHTHSCECQAGQVCSDEKTPRNPHHWHPRIHEGLYSRSHLISRTVPRARGSSCSRKPLFFLLQPRVVAMATRRPTNPVPER